MLLVKTGKNNPFIELPSVTKATFCVRKESDKNLFFELGLKSAKNGHSCTIIYNKYYYITVDYCTRMCFIGSLGQPSCF